MREQIRRAIETHLALLVPAWPTQWENVDFPEPAVNWQRMSLLFGETAALEMGAGSREEWTGVARIDLFIVGNAGPSAAEGRASALRGNRAAGTPGHFYRGLSLSSGGQAVVILQPYDSPRAQEPKWWGFAVMIPFFAQA